MPDHANRQSRDSRLDEAVAEYLEAVDAGRRPSPTDWLARFPDLAPELERFFGDQAQVRSLLGAIGTPPVGPDTPGDGSLPPLSTAVPTAIGEYDIVREIARGGMGVVYQARQRNLNRPVALKMILAGQLASAADVQRFRGEAEAAASLEHPHIVPIYDVGEYQGYPYFTMKLIEGGSLADYAQWTAVWTHAERQRWIAQLLSQVARAVHFAHQRGILHRDLKPSNVLLEWPEGAQAIPYVTDFGLARRLHESQHLTRTGTTVGTPSYMAPEQVLGARSITTAADVYSLGAILYELLCGQPPFRAAHALETLRQVLDRDPVRPRMLAPQIDRDLETVCLKCLDKDPARRYASAAELADDLERFLRGEPVRARRVGVLQRAGRWCRRHPVTAGLSAALIASLVVGASLLTWQWQEAEAGWQWAQEQWHRAEGEKTRAEQEKRQAEKDRAFAKAQWDRAETEKSRAELEATRAQNASAAAQAASVQADEGFKQAHKAVNDLFKVSEGRMRFIAGMQGVRKDLLESARTYYEKFVQDRGDDPGLRSELANTQFRIATIIGMLGTKAEALGAYQKAQRSLEEALHGDPANRELRMWHAESFCRIGILQRETGQSDAALASYKEGIRLYESLIRDYPGQPAYKLGLAAIHGNIGNIHRVAGRLGDARKYFELAAKIEEELTARYPEDTEYRANLAISYRDLGGIEADQNHRAEARAWFRKARDLQEQNLADEPTDLQHQHKLAVTCRLLAGELTLEKKYDEGLRTLERGQLLLEHLVRAEPGIASLRYDLASGCEQAGHLYRNLTKWPEALAQYDKERDLAEQLCKEHPDVQRYRVLLASAHFNRALVLERQGKTPDSLAASQRCAELRRALVKEQPQHAGHHSELGLTLGNQGAVLWNSKKHKEALALFRESVEQHRASYDLAPQVVYYRLFLNGALATLAKVAVDMGHPEETIAAARERQKLWAKDPGQLYACAADMALAAKTWPKSAPPEIGHPADLALSALREAIAAGFRDGARLRKDNAFASLQGREEFEEILQELPD
jgi:serine/threonine-protein kinase